MQKYKIGVVLKGTKRSEHNTLFLQTLHRLHVESMINFKMVLLLYKALNGPAPQYITDMLICCLPAMLLRSIDNAFLVTPHPLINSGEAAIFACCPIKGNTFPIDMREGPLLACMYLACVCVYWMYIYKFYYPVLREKETHVFPVALLLFSSFNKCLLCCFAILNKP